MNLRVLIFAVVFVCPALVVGQDNVFFAGLFPEMAISHSFTKKFQATFKIESQHITYDERLEKGKEWKYEYYRTDFQGFAALKLNPFWKISIGYQYRLDGRNADHHRTIQQVAFVQNAQGIRLGHRLRFDQSYLVLGGNVEARVRYRFSSEFPLEGQVLDPGEFYLLTSNELIFATKGGVSEFENRLVCSVGHYFSKKAKLEAGLDWRIDKLIAFGVRNRLWLKIGLFLNV